MSNNKWCAMCGKWTDHQSGTCPELSSVAAPTEERAVRRVDAASSGSVSFYIYDPGERGAGLNPFDDTVTVSCRSGDFGDHDDFIEHMKHALEQWYDGATVTVIPNTKISHGAAEQL